MIYAYKRRRGCQGCFAFFAVGILLYVVVFSWLVIPGDLWPLKLIFSLPALAMGLLTPGMFMDVFSPGPVLVISAEGLLYQPFSKETVPWPAISGVTLTLGYIYSRGGQERWRSDMWDFVSFTVYDPSRFPKPPGSLRWNGYPIQILPASVQASPKEIVAAISSYWKGEVREVDSVSAPQEH